MSWMIFLLAIFLANAHGQVHHINDHCQKDCSNYHGSRVCASDHQTYANMCEFAIAACLAHEYYGQTIRIRHGGTCSPLNTNNVDHCNDFCNEDIMHVCGSDGIVYDNPCKLKRAQCEAAKLNMTLFLVSKGDSCQKTRQPDCGKYNIDLSDLALEDPNSYRPKCPNDHHYLCASDGHTFSNECQMCAYMENNKVTLNVVVDSQCPH